MLFKDEKVPPWRDQLTFRAFVVSMLLSILLTFIFMKLNLTIGVIPSMNGSAGLLGFFFVKTWTELLDKCGHLKQPFTRQENTIIQTCVVACSGIAFNGGFGNYLFAMSETIAEQSADESYSSNSVKNPHVGWMMGFLFAVSFVGLFSIIPLRKIMIIDYKLMYPSGTATAHLINSFHTPQGAVQAREQVLTLGKFFSLSFLWGFFEWFYTAGDACGFNSFPSLGLQAYQNNFYFDFSATYVGVGMICPYMVNISLLLGAIFSWGLLWPFIETKKGSWYDAKTSDNSMHGLQGYKVFIAIAIILGDGLYNFGKVIFRTIPAIYKQLKHREATLPLSESPPADEKSSLQSYDESVRAQVFVKDEIPTWASVGGYVVLAAVSTAVVPRIFHALKWYHILVIYLVAPVLAFCNAYGCGLTDWSLVTTYGKLAIFAIGSWAGAANGGVLAGLAACGVMMNIISTASDLMADFKTGYLTLASPRSMFISQCIGTAMGCIVSPSVFWLLYSAFPDLGKKTSPYQAPYAVVFRNMAVLGVDGFGSLPKHCLLLCYIFFAAAIIINTIKDLLPVKISKYIPIPMAMAIPFYIGGYFTIDMCVGSLILFVWEKKNKADARAFGPTVASGLICGDGLWTLPSSVFSLFGVRPPICMKFLSAATNAKVDRFLHTT
uniref:Metal-nicotianamine transporter YSL7 n=1 Tax=Kalanchoe fedtschenkoi TaxID=63787 RepID=A0A7N0UL87_KALFE